MQSSMEQAFARLSMLEFVIEVMMANWLTDISPEAEAEFIATMRRRSRSMWIAGHQPTAGEDEAVHRIIKLSVEMGDHFLDKVTARAAEIRAQRSRL